MNIRHSSLGIISSFWFRHSELKMRSLKVFIAVLVIIMLSSCSSVKEKEELRTGKDETEAVQEMTVEAETREPIYVYGKEQEQNLRKVTLKMSSQPILLTSGYVRLVGVVSGPARNASRSDAGEGRPIALIEVGGKGLCAGVGDEISGYRVVNIVNGKVFLKM